MPGRLESQILFKAWKAAVGVRAQCLTSSRQRGCVNTIVYHGGNGKLQFCLVNLLVSTVVFIGILLNK